MGPRVSECTVRDWPTHYSMRVRNSGPKTGNPKIDRNLISEARLQCFCTMRRPLSSEVSRKEDTRGATIRKSGGEQFFCLSLVSVPAVGKVPSAHLLSTVDGSKQKITIHTSFLDDRYMRESSNDSG